MSLMIDVTADQPPLPGQLSVQNFTSEEIACLSEELAVYHQHFASLFYRREQREWTEVYLRGLLIADVPARTSKRWPCDGTGVGSHAERQVRALQQFIGEGKWDDDARVSRQEMGSASRRRLRILLE